MDYNMTTDLLIFAAFLVILGLIIVIADKRARGATKASRKDIERHQGERRVKMKEWEYK